MIAGVQATTFVSEAASKIVSSLISSSAGVNARLARIRAREEGAPLALLEPISAVDPWSPADSLALVKLIPITLTLPGIAGLVLTLAVAADANIVMYERIKEEVRTGRSIPSAISAGYSKALRTIIDANVVTIGVAFILFTLATAGVKGFAFTLGVGTLVSLFTAVLATSAILGTLARTRLLRRPSALGVNPKRCVYLDDLGVNLKPARDMGMTTIKVLNAAQAIAELEAATGLSLTGSA